MPAVGAIGCVVFFFFEEIGKNVENQFRVERGRGVRGADVRPKWNACPTDPADR
ncbi:MAG: hypothetical protein JW913_03005 [Chitinispirillaceae bacterium]|nr:hypothetical protein [Chitinispirillaceae bacterium]